MLAGLISKERLQKIGWFGLGFTPQMNNNLVEFIVK